MERQQPRLPWWRACLRRGACPGSMRAAWLGTYQHAHAVGHLPGSSAFQTRQTFGASAGTRWAGLHPWTGSLGPAARAGAGLQGLWGHSAARRGVAGSCCWQARPNRQAPVGTPASLWLPLEIAAACENATAVASEQQYQAARALASLLQKHARRAAHSAHTAAGRQPPRVSCRGTRPPLPGADGTGGPQPAIRTAPKLEESSGAPSPGFDQHCSAMNRLLNAGKRACIGVI